MLFLVNQGVGAQDLPDWAVAGREVQVLVPEISGHFLEGHLERKGDCIYVRLFLSSDAALAVPFHRIEGILLREDVVIAGETNYSLPLQRLKELHHVLCPEPPFPDIAPLFWGDLITPGIVGRPDRLPLQEDG